MWGKDSIQIVTWKYSNLSYDNETIGIPVYFSEPIKIYINLSTFSKSHSKHLNRRKEQFHIVALKTR